jgi:hypothetical protein
MAKKALLAHETDPMLKAYGIKAEPKMTQVQGRRIHAPQLAFGDNSNTLVQQGEWQSRNAVFKKVSVRLIALISRERRSKHGESLLLDREGNSKGISMSSSKASFKQPTTRA